MPQEKIMLVEDDQDIARALEIVLQRAGYEFSWKATLAEARAELAETMPDLILLDLGLPDGDGGELAIELRSQNQHLPIIMLTARDSIEDRVLGLDRGADDYMVKPVERKELLARIRAGLRRQQQAPAATNKITIGDLVIDSESQSAQRNDRQIKLTKIEFRLLKHLADNRDIIVSRSELLEEVWGYHSESDTNTVDVFISTLRRKLEHDNEPRLLFTSYGRGYILRGDE